MSNAQLNKYASGTRKASRTSESNAEDINTEVAQQLVTCLSLAGAATSIHVFVATKHVFCRDKSMLLVTKLLSRQTQQAYILLATKDVYVFVTTKNILRQKMILVAAPANDTC